MDASNTPADRAANPSCYQHFYLEGDGDQLFVQIRNDLPREKAIRYLRQIADRLESLEVSEGAF